MASSRIAQNREYSVPAMEKPPAFKNWEIFMLLTGITAMKRFSAGLPGFKNIGTT